MDFEDDFDLEELDPEDGLDLLFPEDEEDISDPFKDRPTVSEDGFFRKEFT